MLIAIKASNGKYVSAEKGGGIHYVGLFNNQAYVGVAPLYANRDTVGVWETFGLIENDNGTVSFQTANGFFWTAELGGGAGISTDRREANAWEMFFLSEDNIICWNGLNLVTSEQGSDSHLNGTRTGAGAWEKFTIERLDKPNIDVTDEQLLNFKGNLAGLVISELSYGIRVINNQCQEAEDWTNPNSGRPDTRVLWPPGYVVENKDTRKIIRDTYKNANLTHFPINVRNVNSIYRNIFPPWNEADANIFLEELWNDNIIPVCSIFPDGGKEPNPKVDPDLVRIAFWWEDPKPIVRPALDNDNKFWIAKQNYPKAHVWWHIPPYQGAPFVEYADWGLPQGDPGINAKVWRYMVNECGVKGCMFQGKAWENDSKDSINALKSFSDRLRHGVSGWPIAGLIDSEEKAYYLFNLKGNINTAAQMASKVRNASEITGWMDG